MAAVPAGADAAGADAPPPPPQEPMRQQGAMPPPPPPRWSPSDEVARDVRTAHAEVEKAVARLFQEPFST